MNSDLTDGAACAAMDLGARLAADLASARADLRRAEASFRDAAEANGSRAAAIPFHVRRARLECRHKVAGLQQMLAGLPTTHGDSHAQSA
jgi:hypothetical protein